MIRICVMKDHETPEAIQARAEQTNPIVMYLVVRESLGMGMGKTAAQCAHASQMLTLDYFEMKEESRKLQKKITEVHAGLTSSIIEEYAKLAPYLSIMGEWLKSSFRKVVLSADDKEWAKIKEEFKDENMVLVIDAGLTEVVAGSETCIGLWPMRKSQVPKLVKRLQTLK